MGSNWQMRREAFFSGYGPYDILLRGNVLLHREAAGLLRDELARLTVARGAADPIRILDLACGRTPIVPADAAAAFPDRRFLYTGVDINPDQVAVARQFPFPPNVGSAVILEGSAWDLSDLPPGPYDAVFVGMNWHHGTPEEIWFLAHQLAAVVCADGILVDHDCYRPGGTRYLRRPAEVSSAAGDEELRLVAREPLEAAGPPEFGFQEEIQDRPDPAWRRDLISRLEERFLALGGDAAGARILTEHSWERDYPVSVDEVTEVLAHAEWTASARGYDAGDGPLAPYIATIVARRAAEA